MERYDHEKKRPVVARQMANISVPVTVKPRVNTEGVVSYCYGDPILRRRLHTCEDCHKTEYSFVLSQNVCIEMPIEFAVDTIVGKACIDSE